MVSLSGSGTDADKGDTLAYRWKQTGGKPAVTLKGANTPTPSFTAPTITANTSLQFTLTVSDGHGGKATDTVEVLVRDVTLSPTPTGKLNDTGITTCGDYAYGNSGKHNSDVSCALTTDADGDPVPAGQDGHFGRDANNATNDNTNGNAGFNFTKLSSVGGKLPSAAADWSCVKDNVTGLIWEVKTNDGGLHDKGWTYTWYEPDSSKNGGAPGKRDGGACKGSRCDTTGYVQAVNKVGWCGASDWRMPTLEELQSIADLSNDNWSIDKAYFPNTDSWAYWSGTPVAGDTSYAWGVDFGSGDDYWFNRVNAFRVRLVRSGQ